MVKLRLNTFHRDLLNELARTLVSCPAEQGAMDAAYVVAAGLVRGMVEAVLPPADMRILKKYNCASVDDCTRMQLTAGGVVQFIFEPETGPLSTNCRIFLADEATTNAVTTHKTAKEKYREAVNNKQSDYRALIGNARYYEDVLDVWPEAEQLRSQLGSKAVSIVTDDVIERIRQDIASRTVAA